MVDASVVVKWYVPEADSAQARGVLTLGYQLLAPDLLLPEVGNILWKKVSRGQLTAPDAELQLQLFLTGAPVTLRPSAQLAEPALRIATSRGLTMYDALYVALALEDGCSLVTTDQRLINRLQGTPLANSVVALASI